MKRSGSGVFLCDVLECKLEDVDASGVHVFQLAFEHVTEDILNTDFSYV